MKRQKISQILSGQDFDSIVTVMGWVKTKRDSKKFSFIELNDGSTVKNLQIFIDHSTHNLDVIHAISTGSSIAVKGILVQSQGKGQTHEVQSQSIEVFGLADPEEFPLQKKAHSLEFLREISHFRPRTATFGCVLRLRHAMAFAIHKYFNDKGFYYIHSPIITAADCEGAGEMFQVSTLNLADIPKDKETGSVDFNQDFFGKAAHLTVSGQLQAELAAMALAEVYTFGPTFRAENSNTARHLAEFWMIEPEVAFADLEDNMNLAEDFLKYCIKYALDNNRDDLLFLQEKYDPELIERLQFVSNHAFVRLTYTEAIEILIGSRKTFEYPVSWGLDLQSEHERYLVEEHFKKPVILTDYPKDIKAFYMKLNEDGKTVRAMDVLFPRIGEIIGGSQREEDLQKLITRIREMQLPEENYSWYLDTRRFGTAPHAGFGMGFERLLIFITGMTNIRDVIPFPRYPQHCDF